MLRNKKNIQVRWTETASEQRLNVHGRLFPLSAWSVVSSTFLVVFLFIMYVKTYLYFLYIWSSTLIKISFNLPLSLPPHREALQRACCPSTKPSASIWNCAWPGTRDGREWTDSLQRWDLCSINWIMEETFYYEMKIPWKLKQIHLYPTEAIAKTLGDTYQRLHELPDPKLPVKYPRTPGYRPTPEENPFNAWWETHVN